MNILFGVLVPFLGTVLGSAFVFIMKKQLNEKLQNGMFGFAAGVMAAASVWSLIMPSIDLSADMGSYAFMPAWIGIVAGMAILLAMDKITPKLQTCWKSSSQLTDGFKKNSNACLCRNAA